MKGDEDRYLAAGVSDHLAKPADIDPVFSMLRMWLYQEVMKDDG